jgi:hypothetical protein
MCRLVTGAMLVAAALVLPAEALAQACEGKPGVCTRKKTVEECAQCVRERGWAGQSGGYVYCRCWMSKGKNK